VRLYRGGRVAGLARDTRLDRTVAIKVLPEHLSVDPARRQRFEREAKAISSLNHPNVCRLHDMGQQDGIDILVMECIEGETLAKRSGAGTGEVIGCGKSQYRSLRPNGMRMITSVTLQ
jgi:serine/threonine protein kinase